MSVEWVVQTIVAAAIGAAITFAVFGILGWAWAKRKLLPLLRRHAPALAAMLEAERER